MVIYAIRVYKIWLSARAAYGELDASEGRSLRKRPERKEPEKKPSSVRSLVSVK